MHELERFSSFMMYLYFCWMDQHALDDENKMDDERKKRDIYIQTKGMA